MASRTVWKVKELNPDRPGTKSRRIHAQFAELNSAVRYVNGLGGLTIHYDTSPALYEAPTDPVDSYDVVVTGILERREAWILKGAQAIKLCAPALRY